MYKLRLLRTYFTFILQAYAVVLRLWRGARLYLEHLVYAVLTIILGQFAQSSRRFYDSS